MLNGLRAQKEDQKEARVSPKMEEREHPPGRQARGQAMRSPGHFFLEFSSGSRKILLNFFADSR
jgi:hypothetical protein